MTARITITNTARATIRETWTFTIPDGVTIPDGMPVEEMFHWLQHHPRTEQDCTDEVIGDEDDRDDFRVVEMGAVEDDGPDLSRLHLSQMATCDHRDNATCLRCGLDWCYECDPGPSSQCPVCNGRGYSTATWSLPTGASS